MSIIPFEKMAPVGYPAAQVDEKAAILLWFQRINKKQLFTDALLCVSLTFLLVLGIVNVNTLRQYPTISLRYDNTISGKVAYSVRSYIVGHHGDDAFWPTFWNETQVNFEGEYSNVNAACILFSGDAALVWPAQYLSGTAPGVTDGVGCAVSSSLARELWGGYDIVGKSIGIDDEMHVVRGVFEGSEQLALVSVRDEDTRHSFSAVELSAGPDKPARSDVESFAMETGLGRPDNVLMGTPVSMSAALAALPLVILAIYGLVLCIVRLKSRPVTFRIILLSAFLGFAVILPDLLDMLPGWFIPTRWSDFSFWGNLASQLGGNLREYLTLSPLLRDVEYKVLLYKQIGIAFLSTSCSLSLCFIRRNHGVNDTTNK